MKKHIIILLLFPIISFSQTIVGIWIKNPQSKTAIEFTSDGQQNIIDAKTHESIIKNVKMIYKLESENGEKYFTQTIFRNDVVIRTKKIKYKFKKGKLYLPSETESNGIITVNEYSDEYTRVK